jgi:hypothetical protein
MVVTFSLVLLLLLFYLVSFALVSDSDSDSDSESSDSDPDSSKKFTVLSGNGVLFWAFLLLATFLINFDIFFDALLFRLSFISLTPFKRFSDLLLCTSFLSFL